MVTPREERIAELNRRRRNRIDMLRVMLASRISDRSRAAKVSSRDCARYDIAAIRVLDAKIAALTPKVPSDIRATILELCQTIDQGSTSALFGRIHDVRKWVGER
jgi:hypothetical protein